MQRLVPVHPVLVGRGFAGLVLRSSTVLFLALASDRLAAAGPPDAQALIAAQQRAMQPLAGFDGAWRGPATTTVAGGRRLSLTQTERVGGFLDGSVKMVEGRGFGDDGRLVFNALGVISFAPESGEYRLHATAQGHVGDFPIVVSQDRFVWTIAAGPAKIRYTATVADGVWTEIGERLVEGQPPQRIHEMTLRRVGDTDWPAAGAIPPR